MTRHRIAPRAFAVLVAITTALLVGWQAQAAPAAAADRIAVTVTGKGPDVVLIPGLASSGAVWDATVKQISDRYRVHVVQVAGFAGAPVAGNGEGPVLEPLVAAVDAYIVSAGLRSPAVIGHSMGGLTGLMLARRHPASVGRLMIVDSLPFYPVLFSSAATVEGVRPQAAAMRDGMLALSPEAYAAQQAMTLPRMVKSPEGLKAVMAWSGASSQSVVARAFYDVLTTDLRDALATISTPTTMLYPYDPAMGVPSATVDGTYGSAYAGLPNARLERIDGSFHFIMIDQPQAFAAAVERFLN